MIDWLLLSATLPSSPSATRVRLWRSLKHIGSGTLREGVYLLPAHAPTAAALWDIEKTLLEAGAQAHMLTLQARDTEQENTFKALFDRSEQYLELNQSLKDTKAQLKKCTESELRKALRQLEQQFASIQATDYFPNAAQTKAAEALAQLRSHVERYLSPDEPHTQDAPIAPQSLAHYQGRTWATRKRPWIDRLATAWLVTRFVDSKAQFFWLDTPKKCPKDAVGYDFDGATFSHVGNMVTFEVVLHTFALQSDAALMRLAELVHYIDVGGVPVDEAAGLETVVRGLQAQHPNDDDLRAASLAVFDALYTALRTPT